MSAQTMQSQSRLSSSIRVSRYIEMEKQKDLHGIASFVRERFHERYIKPFEDNENKHGFLMMAAACLMIEALESYWQGWQKSPTSPLAFCQFFDRNARFAPLHGFSREFYVHIRCGIMHQGETTGGWHIKRNLRVLFDPGSKTIDATRFLREIDGSLSDYCVELEKAAWGSVLWKNFRKKMKDVCANTMAVQVGTAV